MGTFQETLGEFWAGHPPCDLKRQTIINFGGDCAFRFFICVSACNLDPRKFGSRLTMRLRAVVADIEIGEADDQRRVVVLFGDVPEERAKIGPTAASERRLGRSAVRETSPARSATFHVGSPRGRILSARAKVMFSWARDAAWPGRRRDFGCV